MNGGERASELISLPLMVSLRGIQERRSKGKQLGESIAEMKNPKIWVISLYSYKYA